LEYKFDIYDNGFAPSDWNFEILAKVRAQDIPVWIGKRTKSLQAADLGWIAEMATKNSALGLSGTPTVYQLAGERCSFVAVYVKNSVVALLDTSEGCVAQGT